jgi:DNA polymerase elongation subunit (family B)
MQTQTPYIQSLKMPKFSESSHLILDIEPTGVGNARSKDFVNVNFDSQHDLIKMIGGKSEKEAPFLFFGHDEENILRNFIYLLNTKKPKLLIVYNGVNFDIPFIVSRLDFFKIPHPFKLAEKPTRINSVSLFGKPIVYHEWEIVWDDGSICTVVDLFFAILSLKNTTVTDLKKYTLVDVLMCFGLNTPENTPIKISNELYFQYMLRNQWDVPSQYLTTYLNGVEALAYKLLA